MFEPVSSQLSLSQVEEKTLKFWREHKCFEKSLENRKGNDTFVFYDGPPFATGLPHYGHLLAGTIKDVIPRYQTMLGKYVPRTFGWDCHGLPVEAEVEKQLNISSKHEIEEYGVEKFNETCRSIVLRYTDEWERLVERTGRWVDFDNGYRTMDRDYMESIWWVFKQLWDKDLIYEGHKILPYCPRCATPLSNFEANQNYDSVQDPSITVRFKVTDQENTYLLAWTTTPWTLPSNTGLATGPDVAYVKVKDPSDQNYYILGSDRLATYYAKETPEVVDTLTGEDLAGLTYEPLFPYFSELKEEGAFKVITADFVTTEEGTGIVHLAPGFGEDDALAGKKNGLPMVCPLDAECRFNSEIPEYAGTPVKKADSAIIKQLKEEGKLINRSSYQHNYPHCWRCEEPLIYRAVSTWFVKVEAVKDRIVAANAKTHWVPDHIRDGRFGKWLENAHDWAISRNRYWGCPLPIWRHEDEEVSETLCLGSISELEELCGHSVEDIHKHIVDKIELTSADGKSKLRRVPEVLDCWFESGSMPYAQKHYPFENKDILETNFPADFIAEGLDQTRGWFYTLMVIGAALFDKPPFSNVIVNGLILAEDGHKMSKRLKNYPDPELIMNRYGADALRLCLLNSPAVRAEDLRFNEDAVKEVMRSTILPLWNAYTFLVTYARVDDYKPQSETVAPPSNPSNELDRWILSRLQSTTRDMREAMDDYKLQPAASRFTEFLDELTNWYIRRSRRRFWKSSNDTDKYEAYATLHHVLLSATQIAAPFIPFVTEEIYQNLRTETMPESVHLTDYPVVSQAIIDNRLEACMDHTMTAVQLGRYLRTQASLKIRQPLRGLTLVSADESTRKDLEQTQQVIADELNVKTIVIKADEEELVELSAKPNFPALGPKLGKKMKLAAAAIQKLSQADIRDLRQGKSLQINLTADESLEITLDDVIVNRHEKEGLTVANERDITAALDTTLDEELELEGIARELISRIQNLRKEMQLDVSDRIKVSYDLPEKAEKALQTFADYVSNETLAVCMQRDKLSSSNAVDINGMTCAFDIVKA